MAVPDHKDLLSRTQDLSFSFLQHFIEHENPWFIKDKYSRYILASSSLISLFSFENNDIYNKNDQELQTLSHEFRERMEEYEKYVLHTQKAINTVEVNYFHSKGELSVRNFTVTPFLFEGEGMTLTNIKGFDDINAVQIIFDYLGYTNERLLSIAPTLEKQVTSYSKINPQDRTSDKQWEVAWLVLAGLSHREISKYTKVNVNNVEKKLQAAYKNLGVYCQQNFLILGAAYNWISYVPRGLLMKERSYILNKK